MTDLVRSICLEEQIDIRWLIDIVHKFRYACKYLSIQGEGKIIRDTYRQLSCSCSQKRV
jgi:hypothetical protein